MAGNFASQKDCLEFHDQGVDTFFFACLRENMEIEALKRSLETLEWQTLLGMPQNEWSAKDVESEDAVNNAILNLPISTIHQILQDISQHQPASDSMYIPSHFKDVEPLQSTSNFIPEKDSSCYKTGFLPASNGYSSAISFTESGTRNHSISTTVENAYHKAARPIVLGDGKEIIPQHGSSYVFQNVPDSSFWYTAQELSETKAEELGRMIRSYPVELLESELQIPSMQQESTTKKRNILRPNGRKDRHSKVKTAKGLRDRRVRLSVLTATQFYEIQDRLGYDHPSKAVEWLMKKAKQDIDELPPANLCSNEGSQC